MLAVYQKHEKHHLCVICTDAFPWGYFRICCVNIVAQPEYVLQTLVAERSLHSLQKKLSFFESHISLYQIVAFILALHECVRL